jgi:hypothetical protein
MPDDLTYKSDLWQWPALGNRDDEAGGQKEGRRIPQRVLLERLMAAGGSRQQYAVILNNQSGVRIRGRGDLLWLVGKAPNVERQTQCDVEEGDFAVEVCFRDWLTAPHHRGSCRYTRLFVYGNPSCLFAQTDSVEHDLMCGRVAHRVRR